jgi:hypothetical protein
MIRVDSVGVEPSRDRKVQSADRWTESSANVEVGEDSPLARTAFVGVYQSYLGRRACGQS